VGGCVVGWAWGCVCVWAGGGLGGGGGVGGVVCVCGVCVIHSKTRRISVQNISNILKIRTSQIRIHKQSRFFQYICYNASYHVRRLCMAIGMLSGRTQHGTI